MCVTYCWSHSKQISLTSHWLVVSGMYLFTCKNLLVVANLWVHPCMHDDGWAMTNSKLGKYFSYLARVSFPNFSRIDLGDKVVVLNKVLKMAAKSTSSSDNRNSLFWPKMDYQTLLKLIPSKAIFSFLFLEFFRLLDGRK